LLIEPGAGEVVAELRDEPSRTGDLRELFRVSGYRRLCVSSILWHTTRGGGLFTTAYLLTQVYGKPMINQLAGAMLFLPMLGGIVVGAYSDRFERKRLILAVQMLLMPVEFVMFWLVQRGDVRLWMTVAFMFLLGLGGLVNMTAQRPMIYEMVGPRLAARAMTIESTAQAASMTIGTLIGGLLIDRVGIGAAYFGMGILLCLSMLLLLRVPGPTYRAPRNPAQVTSLRAQLQAGRRLLRRSAPLQAMLLGTVVVNLTLFGFIPLVPVLARQFGDGAQLAGLLAAAPGFGQILAGSVLASHPPARHFLLFVGGCVTGLGGVLLLSGSPVFPLAFVALLVTGVGTSAFASMQSLLAIESAGESERGVALGLMSTCIGALPIGAVVLGALAELLGTRAALATSTSVGLVLFGFLTVRFRVLVRAPAPQLVHQTARRN
jgi:predicted MFS family arabinose efflux permease